MHENIIKQQQFLLLPLRILLRILVHLIDRLVFLPCVEVIPEHTDRAARIKQSRVKMMRLKAKNRKRRTQDGRARVGGEKKSDQRIFRGGDKNIQKSLRKTFRFYEEFRYVASPDYQNLPVPSNGPDASGRKNCPVIVSPSHPLSRHDERKARGLNMDSHIHASSTRTDMRKRERESIERTGVGLIYRQINRKGLR